MTCSISGVLSIDKCWFLLGTVYISTYIYICKSQSSREPKSSRKQLHVTACLNNSDMENNISTISHSSSGYSKCKPFLFLLCVSCREIQLHHFHQWLMSCSAAYRLLDFSFLSEGIVLHFSFSVLSFESKN